ncbi:MAG: cupin [Gemmatimonadetes bacterium]|nr:cupin [Gemmatimonadota bacterium]
MPKKIENPSRVECVGTKPKIIEEYVGRVNTDSGALSIAHMKSPAGWEEPGQRPAFDEYTIVLKGELVVEHEAGTMKIGAGQGVLTRDGEWVRYSTPGSEGAEYIAVCTPAFSPDTVNRDDAGEGAS